MYRKFDTIAGGVGLDVTVVVNLVVVDALTLVVVMAVVVLVTILVVVVLGHIVTYDIDAVGHADVVPFSPAGHKIMKFRHCTN